MNILDQWLKKRGVKNYDELTQEERKVYDEYEKALNIPDITVAMIESFVRQRLNVKSNLVIDFENSAKKDLFIKAEMSVLRSLLAFITKDQETKKMVEETLNKEIKQ